MGTIRHLELVSLSTDRILIVLIMSSGSVEQQIVELKVRRPSHECLNGSSLRRRERLESSDAVDEEAVPLVRRDAPGAGVGVGNAQITHQVAIMQYPVATTGTIRHLELVSLSTDRILIVLIMSSPFGRSQVVKKAVERVGRFSDCQSDESLI
jgi:transcriptional regulator of heat shock response